MKADGVGNVGLREILINKINRELKPEEKAALKKIVERQYVLDEFERDMRREWGKR